MSNTVKIPANVLLPSNRFQVGVSTTTGVTLTSSRTAAVNVYADDGETALSGSAACRAIQGRFKQRAATSDVGSVFGVQGQCQLAASRTGASGVAAGVWALLEVAAGATVTGNACAVWGHVEVPSTAVIAASTYLAAFNAFSTDLRGTHTGKAVGFRLSNPSYGAWDGVFQIDAGNTTAVVDSDGSGAYKYLVCYIGDTAYKIAARAPS